MAPRLPLFLLAATLSAFIAADPVAAQSNASAENAPALLRPPWTRSSVRFERTWRFLGPLSADEATANISTLLKPDGPAAARWTNQTGWTDAVDVAVTAPAGFALGRVNVHRDHDGEATLLVGAEGGLEVFVNGEAVYRRAKPQPFAFDQEAVSAILKQGDNDIVLRLEHHDGPWKVSLRAVEPGTVLPAKQEIDPSIAGSDGKTLSVQTHRESAADRASVEVEIVAPGGTIVAHRNGKRGEVLSFPTSLWADGPYEVRCSTDDGWGRRRFVHLAWYKGDPLPAVRELVAQAPHEAAGPAGDTIRLLAEMVQDRLHGKLDSAGPDAWRGVHSPLMEYRELLLARAGKAGGIRPTGFVRLAYTDEVDGSTQYCRAYLPAGYDPGKKWPLVLFLHGYNPGNPRYIGWWSVDERHNADAENSGAIIIEPHGRGNTLYRGIGEKDVLRVVAEAKRVFAVDDDRVYLTGESMGGYGTWTVATRNPDVFAAAAPVYGGWDLRLASPNLGGLAGYLPTNDVQKWILEIQSGFVSAENARNLPLFIHHGDSDKAVSVENSRYALHLLERWGYEIGYEEHVGWGHEDLLSRGRIVDWLLTHRRATAPKAVRLRAPDLGAASAYWLRVDAWEQAARLINVDAEFMRPGLLRLDTENVAALTLAPPESLAPAGSELTVVWNGKPRTLNLKHRQSAFIELGDAPKGLAKHRGLEGTISDVITTPFLVVIGTSSPDAAMRAMCRLKADAFADNWMNWQHQHLRVKNDRDVTDEDKRGYSLILVGGPDANSVARELASKLPLAIDATGVTIDGHSWPATDAVVQMIYPSPLAPERYVLEVAGTSATGLYFWKPALWQLQIGYATVQWDWTIQDGHRVVLPLGAPAEDSLVAAGVFDRSWRRDDRTTFAGNTELREKSPWRHGPLPPEAAAKVSVKAFVGQYELFPGFDARLFEQDGKFLIQLPGQPALPLIPESDTDFGNTTTGASVRFVTGPDQQVTSLVVYLDGHENPLKRLP